MEASWIRTLWGGAAGQRNWAPSNTAELQEELGPVPSFGDWELVDFDDPTGEDEKKQAPKKDHTFYLGDALLCVWFQWATRSVPERAAIANVCKRWRYCSRMTESHHTLVLTNRAATDADLDHISDMGGLRHLDLRGCAQLTDAGIQKLCKLKKLESLRMGGLKKVTKLDFISGMPSLEFLEGNNCSGLGMVILNSVRHTGPSHKTATTQVILDGRSALPGLKHLSLHNCQLITDKSIEVLAGLTGLQFLDVGNCPRLSNACMSSISEMRHMVSLNVSNNPLISDDGLDVLRGAKRSMRHLDISGCNKVTDTGIKSVARNLKYLETLRIARCTQLSNESLKGPVEWLLSLRTLDLTDCLKINDSGIAALQNLHELETLKVAGCNQLTDRLSDQLKKMRGLKTVDIRNCWRLTDKIRKILHRDRPDLGVIWRDEQVGE
jgi:hypothetical protein